jgi:hypothetical protein
MLTDQLPRTSQEQHECERVRRLLLEAPAGQAEAADGQDRGFVPLPPMQPQNGTKPNADSGLRAELRGAALAAESLTVEGVDSQEDSGADATREAKTAAVSYHRATGAGTKLQRRSSPRSESPPEENAMQALIQRALAQSKGGRPSVFDDHSRGKLVALLALGLSVRQSATVLGVSHPTILRALAADQELREEVTAARYQAQLQPLGCVIREAQRSWRAATWLLKYMDGKLAGHEETPDEKRERQERERVENQLHYEQREAARAGRERERQKEAEAERLAERRAEIEAMFPRRKRKPQKEAPK